MRFFFPIQHGVGAGSLSLDLSMRHAGARAAFAAAWPGLGWLTGEGRGCVVRESLGDCTLYGPGDAQQQGCYCNSDSGSSLELSQRLQLLLLG